MISIICSAFTNKYILLFLKRQIYIKKIQNP